jgi:hypothetical protein
MDKYGFIITRHVNSVITNNYWNQCIKLLRKLYPETKIVIIDDNSNQNMVKSQFNYDNILIIQSEFPGRGELLPYYYYIKNNFFDNAIILHDSVFIHKRINFSKLNGNKVIPLWHFISDNENISNSQRIIQNLLNSYILKDKLNVDVKIGMPFDKWYGCFGAQCYINRDFLIQIDKKYNICNMVSSVLCRADRCCLERIMGCIFSQEYPEVLKIKSLFGDITTTKNWRKCTFEQYMNQFKTGVIHTVAVKVWTGR